MALTRTMVTDDDGTGTTGTPWNAAQRNADWDVVDGRWSRITVTSTGSVNNLSITTGGVEADLIIFNNASDLTITGIVAPTSPLKPAKPLRYMCIGAGNVFFKHQNASSTAANRLACFVSSGDTPNAGGSATQPGGRGAFDYDDLDSRWVLHKHDQGAWITPATPTFSGNGAMTWTSVTVNSNRYWVRGRQLFLDFDFSGTVGGTPNTLLTATLPNGYTVAASHNSVIWEVTDARACIAQTSTGGVVNFTTDLAVNNWTAGTRRVAGSHIAELT